MLNKTIRILNFDDSIIKQRNLISQYKTEIIDLRDLGPRARVWLAKVTRDEIGKRIRPSPKGSITFLGSGDFHHISNILIDQYDEEICVILFDFHPDWNILPPRLGYGSWVSESLKNRNILKFVLIGVSSSDISSFWIQTGNLNSLENDRVEIYPYSHVPTLTFFKKIPQNLSIKIENNLFFNKIYWNELKSVNLMEFFTHVVKRLPTKRVYISIDKDCLKNEYALTNWEEGRMTLEELLLILKLIKENLDIVGLDIVGDYSKISIEGTIKKIASYFDHPKVRSLKDLSESYITEINERTNLEILKILNL